jgi:subtilase family serine protease
MATERLERLPGGANRTVTFTWLAKGGGHTLKFWVDPDNLIIETNKNDNIAKESVNVQSSGLGELPGFEMPLLFLALAGAAFLAVLRKRK